MFFPLLEGLHQEKLASGLWYIGLLAFNLSFQVAAFLGEHAITADQARFVGHVEGWVKTPGGDSSDDTALT